MKTYERNMADTALVVKSLTVLDKIDGGGIKEIRNSVESVKRQTAAQAKQQEQYWKSLSDDGVITVIEKQTLYRETQNIARSYSAITQQAASLQITAALLADYNATYNALHNYLYTTLKVFDDMSSETVIDDRNTFNTYFSNYYFEENFVLIAITAGILDTLEFRVLESLTEPGEEGETAIYQGGLYQYVNGAWKSVTTGAYKGPRTELPGGEEGAFFIVSESFTLTEGLIINGEELYVNGEALGITHTYIKGLIYYCQDGVWIPENDKTNWRYAAAFADVINITGELPQIFQDAIDDLQAQVDTKASAASLQQEIQDRQGQETIINGDIVRIDGDIEDIIDRVDNIDDALVDQAEDISGLDGRATNLENQMAGKISHLPVYFGPQSTIPQNPQEGDYFLYSGSNNQKWIKSIIYRWKNNSWYETPNTSPYGLDPTNIEFRSYYMMALEDVLATNVAGNGYYSTIFAQAFFGNSATLNSLATKEIYLRQNGYIQSDNVTYVAQTTGLKLDADGDIDANGDTHIAGKVAIGVPLKNTQGQYMPDFNDYDVVIGGRTLIKSGTKIKGELEGATGTFSGALSGASGTFEGLLQCGSLQVTNRDLTRYLFNIPANTYVTDIYNVLKNYCPHNDDTYHNVSDLFSSYNTPVLKYGNTIIRNMLLDYFQPYSDVSCWVYFNDGAIKISTSWEYPDHSEEPLQLTYVVPGNQILQIINLPDFKPIESGIVYADSNNFLKIT